MSVHVGTPGLLPGRVGSRPVEPAQLRGLLTIGCPLGKACRCGSQGLCHLVLRPDLCVGTWSLGPSEGCEMLVHGACVRCFACRAFPARPAITSHCGCFHCQSVGAAQHAGVCPILHVANGACASSLHWDARTVVASACANTCSCCTAVLLGSLERQRAVCHSHRMLIYHIDPPQPVRPPQVHSVAVVSHTGVPCQWLTGMSSSKQGVACRSPVRCMHLARPFTSAKRWGQGV